MAFTAVNLVEGNTLLDNGTAIRPFLECLV